jgi:hypothetical protein
VRRSIARLPGTIELDFVLHCITLTYLSTDKQFQGQRRKHIQPEAKTGHVDQRVILFSISDAKQSTTQRNYAHWGEVIQYIPLSSIRENQER